MLKAKHWFVFISVGLIWSSSFMWIKISLREIGPDMLVGFRTLFGVLFCIVVILIQRIKLPRTFKEWSPLFLLGITNIAIPFFLIAWGEQSIDSSVASILDSTVPLFTIIIAHFLVSDDKMTISKISGLLIGFAGVFILVSKDFGASASPLLGQAAVILASFFYAVSAVIVRKATQNTPGILRSAGPLLSGTIIMWIAAFTFESPLKLPQLGITWTALLFMGILGSGFAFLMVFWLIHEIGPTRTSMITYIFPLGGVLLGVIFLREQLTWQIVAGGLLIITSLVVSNKQPDKASSTQKPSPEMS
jgi:drug/metabolite transporter (DMT)-like permease